MNDFTKKELEKILEGLGRLPPKWNSKNKCWDSDLEIKIQYLIDNYCSHNGEIGKDYPGEKCMKCCRMWE
ncbi:MAG TPA: hypothetical protein VNU45_12710 [Rummeliibacillus sp.]|nr:hypothetical protein [Rummeliibacillus sp.]